MPTGINGSSVTDYRASGESYEPSIFRVTRYRRMSSYTLLIGYRLLCSPSCCLQQAIPLDTRIYMIIHVLFRSSLQQLISLFTLETFFFITIYRVDIGKEPLFLDVYKQSAMSYRHNNDDEVHHVQCHIIVMIMMIKSNYNVILTW